MVNAGSTEHRLVCFGHLPPAHPLSAYVTNVFVCAKASDIFIMQISVFPLLSPYTVGV